MTDMEHILEGMRRLPDNKPVANYPIRRKVQAALGLVLGSAIATRQIWKIGFQ